MSRKLVIVIIIAAGIAWQIASWARIAFRAPTTEEPIESGMVFQSCPKCSHQVVLSPGKETRCASCGQHLAACERCAKTLVGPDVASHDPGTAWLCEEHREETQWESARLREFESKDDLTPPPETPRAVRCRRHYESQVREVFSKKKDLDDELFPPEKRWHIESKSEAAPPYPERVIDAYRFYERAVTNRDNGTVGIFLWNFEGSPIFLVRCDTDGSDGFLEIYDTDGSPLGFARTDWGCPAWTSRGVVRRRAFTGDRDDVDRQVNDAVKRLRGNSS